MSIYTRIILPMPSGDITMHADGVTYTNQTDHTTHTHFIPRAKRFDSGKPRLDLVPVSTIQGLAEVLTFGAEKYGDNNWRNGMKFSRAYASLMRHLLAYWSGQDNDLESGLPHLHHVLCNVAFLVEYTKTHPELDDRPNKETP